MPNRITLRRTAGWRKPPDAITVSRPTIWGNPFTVAAAQEAGCSTPHRAAVDAFAGWLQGNFWACGEDRYLVRRALILSRLPELRGRDLACWCPPGCACHADVLMELAND